MLLGSLLLASIHVFTPLAASGQDAPPPSEKFSQQFWQLAETLRPKLDTWKTTVDGFDFSQLKAGKAQEVLIHALEGDKQQCLQSLTMLWLQIPNVKKFQGASLVVRTMLQIIFLHNQLQKLNGDLNIVFAVALASGSMSFDDPQSRAIRDWTSSRSHISADLGNNFQSKMQLQMTQYLTMVDVELTQSRVQKPTTP